MEMVQLGRLILCEQRSHQRITGRFYRAIGNTDQQGGEKKAPVTRRIYSHYYTGQMKNKGRDQQLLHSDDINYEAADDDRQRKTPEGRGGNSPQLGSVEVKIL